VAFDNAFVVPAAVAASTAAANVSGDVRVHALVSGVGHEHRRRFEASVPADVEWHEVDSSGFEHLPVIEGISELSYGRLLLPDVLPNVSRVLYLDSDTLVCESLDELFAIPLLGLPAAAVTGPHVGVVSASEGVPNWTDRWADAAAP
jgi:lipopolysaccharide biosynthesis glycosyltransferase